MERHICIHGHFYQPPRENPWLESIELQDSAYPHHDWNERITDQCYAPNSASRILNDAGLITGIMNNYSKISFNFGPTLLSWMEMNAFGVYQAILDADRQSMKTFSGHGSAMAQAYNHVILPLANRRDKYTQMLWGVMDFESRFGRSPEGLWLPETAVDIESLEILAELGIRFTVLAPHQAKRTRPIGGTQWHDVKNATIDPKMPYLMHLPSGRSLALFFYDGPTSRAVAFEQLLASGVVFADRLIRAFSEEDVPQLVSIATDGETYGHHHRFGDMALAYAIHHIESNGLARLTNYGEHLEKHPPTHEVQIIENTSWSCSHGIERWRSDCGCNTGSHPGWNQAWRAPLRAALDWLRDTVARKYEEKARTLLADPWRARDQYIAVVLDRSPESIGQFVTQQAIRDVSEEEKTTIVKLLELQRHSMLMYTSCGWFFDELSGIETVQVIQYAGRVVQQAEELFGQGIESRFLEYLEKAKSNIPEHRDGRRIYEKFVKPAIVDLTWVAAHYAISSLFEEYDERTGICCYEIELEDHHVMEAGRARLAVGRLRATSRITLDSATHSYGVLHFGDHNISAGVREYQGQEEYDTMIREVSEVFSTAEFAEVVRMLDKHFGTCMYSLRTLFRDEQRKVLDRILASTLGEIEASYRQVYDLHYPLMLFLDDLGNPLPRALHAAAEFVLNTDLARAVSGDSLDMARIGELLDTASLWDVTLDREGLSYEFKQTLEGMAQRFSFALDDLPLLEELSAIAEWMHALPLDVSLWRVQNIYYQILMDTYPDFRKKASQGDQTAREWVAKFLALGENLSIRVE